MQLLTERLSMRKITHTDWPLFLKLHSNPDVIEYCFDRPEDALIRKKFEQRLPAWDVNSRHPLCFVVIHRETQQMIGVTGFTSFDGTCAELGYLFLPEYFGRGYATESLKAVIEWGYETCGINKFKAIVTAGNKGSENLLSKCGLTHTDTIADAYTIANTKYDDLIYTLNL